MSDQDAFDRILASLHDAMLDDSLWPATSALIDEACGIQGNALLVGEGPKDAIQDHFVGLCYRGQRRADWEREYLEIYLPIAEHAPRFRQLPDSHLVHITDLYTAQELQTSPTYNEAFSKGDAQDSLTVRLDGPGGSIISWSPLDPVTPGGWGSQQLAMIKRLLPHLQQFIRVRQALVGAEALGTSLTALLDNTRIGIIHLDQRGQIIAANDRARDLLRHGHGLTDQGGVLHARTPADRDRLARLVAAALPTSSSPPISGTTTLHQGALLPRLVVHVKPVGVRQYGYGARRTAVLVLVAEPGRAPRIDPGLVAATLGLTQGESQVAVWVAEGWTAHEIAVATGRTDRTIRWHMQQIYHKHGISRQADLVRLVLSVATVA